MTFLHSLTALLSNDAISMMVNITHSIEDVRSFRMNVSIPKKVPEGAFLNLVVMGTLE